jgi:predicted ATPase/DNA-binding SARP family transcriptional activator
MGHHLSLSLLGTFQVTLNSQPVIHFAYDKVRALLVYLAVEADITHRRDSLAALLWPEQADTVAHKSLNQALYVLRKALGDQEVVTPFILVDHGSVRLNPTADIWLDAGEFARRLAEIETTPGTIAAPDGRARLQEALNLYHGDFLQGFMLPDSPAFDDWAALQRERLHRQAVDGLFALASYHERRGELAAAIQCVRRLLGLEPWREEARRLLMALLARSGQRSAALAQYEQCRRILAAELNASPAAETNALYMRIKAAVSTPRHNLPAQPTPFIGRQAELDHLAQLVAEPATRLITLVGPGGMGKSRLALAAAAREVDNFAFEGIFFVDLAAASHSDLASGDRRQIRNEIASGIARALDLHFPPDEREPAQQLLDFLRHKAMLLILDSFEHLLAGADLVSRILQAAPDVKILTTSREPLQLIEEQLFPVPGLAFTPEQFNPEEAAAQLFRQRASRVQLDFDLQQSDLPHLAAICRQVDGMPLALELAAAWVTTLSLAEIAAEIQRSLEILTADLRNLPPRQRSVTAVLDASWQRLTPAEQRLLSRLSLFAGSFDRLAAQAVAGASLPALSALATRSLLHRYHRPHFDGQRDSRFTLHELVRRFAAQQLAADPDEEAAARQAYLDYYTAFLKKRQVHLDGPERRPALAEINLEYDNARRAVSFACAGQHLAALGEIQEALFAFYLNAHHALHEAALLFGQMATAVKAAVAVNNQVSPGVATTLTSLLWRQAYFCAVLGKLDQAASLNNHALELAQQHGDQVAEVAILSNLGGLARRVGDAAGSLKLLYQALQKAEAAQKPDWLADTKQNLARVLLDTGNTDEARPLLEAARQIWQQLGIPDFYALILLGRLNIMTGALEEADRQLTEAANSLNESGGHALIETSAYINLGRLTLRKGDREEAQRHLTQALRLARELGLAEEVVEAEMLLGSN